MKYDVNLSKKGYSTISEQGGGWSNTGSATIICDKDGERKTPIYTGHRCNETHATFFAHKGDYIIESRYHRDEIEVTVYQVTDNTPVNNQIEVEKVNEYSNGEWDNKLLEILEEPVNMAIKKCHEYHCRSIYYANPKKIG